MIEGACRTTAPRGIKPVVTEYPYAETKAKPAANKTAAKKPAAKKTTIKKTTAKKTAPKKAE